MTAAECLEKIDGVRVGVVGDFCLDVYWYADMRRSELSRETPHFPLPIVREKESPGGAGNVACNLAALRPASVFAAGIVGDDWRGTLLRNRLQANGVDCSALIVSGKRTTNTYIKPMRMGISDVIYEDPRLDFENHTAMPEDVEANLLSALDVMMRQVDVLCVCDQMRCGCVTPAIRERICEYGAQGKMVLVDSRDRVSLYRNVIVKPNDVEAGAMDAHAELPMEEIVRRISQKTGRPALITMGSKGCLVCEENCVTHVPGRRVEPPLDCCGAGDTFLSALACLAGAGLPLWKAAEFANAASAVIIRKIGTTGTATRQEILSELQK